MNNVYADSGMRLPLRMRDGKPVCPCCSEPMVETDPGYWACADAVAAEDELTAGVGGRWGVSTRSSVWVSPEVRGYSIHVYRETLDNRRLWVDISRGYGFAFCLSRPWRWTR